MRGRSYAALSWLTGALLLVLWWVVTHLGWVDPVTLPSPEVLFGTATDFVTKGYAGKSALTHVMASVARTFTGLAGGILLGVPVGLVVSRASIVLPKTKAVEQEHLC